MAAFMKPPPPPSLLLLWRTLFFLSTISLINSSQPNSPQNIETHYPSYSPPPVIPPPSPPPPSTPLPPPSPPPPSPPPPPPPPEKSSSDSNKRLATAVGVTAAGTLVLSALFFFFLLRRRAMLRRRKGDGAPVVPLPDGGLPPVVISRDEFSRFDGALKGLIVDENGLDVLYWRKLHGSKNLSPRQRSSFKRAEVVAVSPPMEQDAEEGHARKIQEVPLLRGKSSASELNTSPARPEPSLPPLAPRPPQTTTFAAVPSSSNTAPPLAPAPPPPLPIARQINNPRPPPPPQPPSAPPQIAGKSDNPRPPPPPVPPPRPGSTASSLKPLPPPAPKSTPSKAEGPSSSGGGSNQVRLKPLHWDKVNVEKNNSMVWNKIEGGSFKLDDDLMVAMFGTVAVNRKTPKGNTATSSNPGNVSPGGGGSSQIFILDTRKSQNIAIVLKSLSVSRKDILDALAQGRGLDLETLEKLNKITPTADEESAILSFDADPRRLADAESFLFHILKAIPSAFTRFNAMLFKLSFETEILQVRELIQSVELGCQELRKRGLFMKLLEAILKAGNRMNAGTSRGNAQAFNLSALKKLSDVKSTDGKTTLLHFVVEEVVRSEGRRCVMNRTRNLSRSGSLNGSVNAENHPTPKEDKEKEYIMLGLPLVGGLSAEYTNVKKAAAIDYESFAGSCGALQSRVSEIQQLVSQCQEDGGGFAREMKGFLGVAEAEVASLRKYQTNIVELVKATTEYYQAGASSEKGSNPIKIFVIIRDFLEMVDQVCVEIARNAQKRKPSTAGPDSTSPSSSRKVMRFPKLSPNFFSDDQSDNSNSET